MQTTREWQLKPLKRKWLVSVHVCQLSTMHSNQNLFYNFDFKHKSPNNNIITIVWYLLNSKALRRELLMQSIHSSSQFLRLYYKFLPKLDTNIMLEVLKLILTDLSDCLWIGFSYQTLTNYSKKNHNPVHLSLSIPMKCHH